MATNITVFDPVTQNTRTISVDIMVSIIEDEMDGVTDEFIVITTNAKKKTGAAIPPHAINALSDLARGATQQDGFTATPYASMTAAVNDHILNMVDGTGGSDAMSFTL